MLLTKGNSNHDPIERIVIGFMLINPLDRSIAWDG